ncbi:MAG TPA: glycosyltransferase, partial [Actinoplanes sp.]|nr:glycosyltransferase [Actinoplanes sp.]
MRIAMISEHTGPLSAAGQDVQVADLSDALAGLGHDVHVYTRRADPDVAEVVVTPGGVRVINVTAGPARPVPSDLLLPYMGEFARLLADRWRDDWMPEVAHAHSWTSGR